MYFSHSVYLVVFEYSVRIIQVMHENTLEEREIHQSNY